LRGREIQLNFLALNQQQFQFPVWRKLYAGEKKEGTLADCSRKTLPISDSPDIREDYWVSFQQKPNFEKFICKSNHNNLLTLDLLYEALKHKARLVLDNKEYWISDKGFERKVHFVLKVHPEGEERVWLRPYYLGSLCKFGFLLDFRFRKNSNVPFNRKIQILSLSLDKDYRSNRNFYIDRRVKISEFQGRFLNRLFPMEWDGLKLSLLAELEKVIPETLAVKTYLFKNGHTGNSQYKGLTEYGPFGSLKQPLRLVGICREKDETLLNDLFEALSGKSANVNFAGFEKIFGQEADERIITVPDYSVSNLEFISQEIAKSAQDGRITMPVAICDKIDDKTYFGLKYRLLRKNLPLQVVTVDLLRRWDGLKWSTSNIALQIFAKGGGQPWKVRPTSQKCVICGIGQSHRIRDGEVSRYFAYSISTDSSGLYKEIRVLGKSDSEQSYLQQLRTNIQENVRQYLQEGYEKCVLHIPFKVRRYELDTISDAIKSVADASSGTMDFVVLKVNTQHDFFGYADTNSLVPYESSCLSITSSQANNQQYLVWFEGLQYHRETIIKRIGGPIHIEFYWTNKKLTEPERKTYLQDLLNLSGANWRGFNAKNLPVSVYYCQLVADFIQQFPTESDAVGVVNNPWFL
jgi:hypothetical protein